MRDQFRENAIVRMAIASVLFVGIVLILPPGVSIARDVATVQHSNPTSSPATSLKTVIVGDYYPYTFVNDKGIPDGFSIDIAKAVAQVIDLKLIITVDNWDHALKALADGVIDFLPSMAYSPERDKTFDFSPPHTIAYDAVFLREGSPRINSLKDLAGKTVIVLNKDIAHQYLLSSGMSVKIKLVLVDSLSDALRTLATGKGDAALMPKLVGLIYIKKLNLTNLDPAPIVIDNYNRPFCFAVRDGNQALLERLSQGMLIIKSTGQYQEIYNNWFGALEPRGLPWKTVIKYIAAIIAVFLLIGSGLIIWTVSLRKQVALRTKNLVAEIQERKRAEEAIIVAKNDWENTFDTVTDMVTIHDEDFNIVRANPAARTMLGLHLQEEMPLAKCFKCYHGTEKPPSGCASCQSLQTGKPSTVEMFEPYLNKHLEIMAMPRFGSDGRLVGLIHVVRDITERKKAEENLKETLESLRKAVGTTIQVISSTVEARDPYTSGHQTRSANLARAIAMEMGLPQDKVDAIRMAGSIHDIGKISIPAEILSKPTKLSEIEFALIKEHAHRGFEMLKDVESPWPLAEIVYQHHERMDGSGYPRHLKGEEILMEARILTVADVVEAMASHRPYRPGLGIDAALNELEKNKGIFYDNAVADACLKLFREKGFKLEGI